jgi:glycosyltransferase involved in cell wall biosynthesis
MQNSEIWLDLSRMLWRVFHGKMTGIDRVDIAYAEHLMETAPDRLHFVALDYWTGSFRVLPDRAARQLVSSVSICWRDGTLADLRLSAGLLLLRSLITAPIVPRYKKGAPRPIYLNTSMHPVQWPSIIGRMVKRTGAIFVPMIHDLIPIEHPEYVPVAWTRHHLGRIQSITSNAGGVIANSATTAEAIRRYIPTSIPVLSSRIGVTIHSGGVARSKLPPLEKPYFVCLGTLEPRKNHLMLLNVWRDLVMNYGEVNTPTLVVVGRRGWENEQIVDMLERCATIRNVVVEMGSLSDADVDRLLIGSRGLLMPSFIEGYGLPVAEAMARGVPVICSDIPAHREICGDIPVFIDPLDGPAWRSAIIEYTRKDSLNRLDQIKRLREWDRPRWDNHIRDVLNFIDNLRARSSLEDGYVDALEPINSIGPNAALSITQHGNIK